MRIRLEKRLTPSRFMQVATPVASVLLTMLLGAIIFQLIGFDGPRAIYETFITPIVASYKWHDVATKAAPLIIIALGLSLGNQAKIWNIGAEGQYIIGALAGAGVAFALPDAQGFWVILLMIAAGIVGGMAWAAIPAFLKTRYRVSEVLSTLMLVHVALQVLNYLVSGPWKDPTLFGALSGVFWRLIRHDSEQEDPDEGKALPVFLVRKIDIVDVGDGQEAPLGGSGW
jgi:general nucleoside transport system permease protein